MKKTHVVHFELNGGSPELEDQIVEDNKKIEEPRPKRPSFYFMGWYEDKKLTKEFDENTRITEDTTLYAAWGHSVSLMARIKDSERLGGGYVNANKEGYARLKSSIYPDKEKIKLSVETEDGFVFVEWANGDKTVSIDENYSFVVNEDTDLTAYFQKE